MKQVLVAVALGLLAEHPGAQENPAYGTVKPYSLKLDALKGMAQTDLVLTVTALPGYTTPSSIKTLVVKAMDSGGGLKWTKTYRDLSLTGGQCTLTLTDLERYDRISAHANVQTTESVNNEVLRAATLVLLRPDLAIERVVAPAQVAIHEPVNVEVVVRERNGDLGAAFDGQIEETGAVLDAATGVSVTAGGVASLVFTLAFTQAGVHPLTARLMNCVPGEYDAANNAYDFQIEVVAPEPLSYYISYSDQSFAQKVRRTGTDWRWLVYESGRWTCLIDNWWTEESVAGMGESFLYRMPLPKALRWPVESLSIEVFVDGVSRISKRWAPFGTFKGRYENPYLPRIARLEDGTWVYLGNSYLLPPRGPSYYPYYYNVPLFSDGLPIEAGLARGLTLQRYAGDIVWAGQWYSQVWGSGSGFLQEKSGSFWHARQDIQTLVVVTDEGISYGGFSRRHPVLFREGHLDYASEGGHGMPPTQRTGDYEMWWCSGNGTTQP